jgi:hypothetical protein
MLAAPGIDPFKIPEEPAKIIERARELNTQRDEEELELSVLLDRVETDKLYLSRGYKSLAEYAEKELDIGGSKARQMSANYGSFVKLGLRLGLLGGPEGVSFSKFKVIVSAVNKELITSKSVVEWLPLLKKSGRGALTRGLLEEHIKALAQTSEVPADVERRLSFAVPAEMYQPMLNAINTFREAAGIESDGAAITRALALAASAHIEDGSKTAASMGLLGLREMMAQMAPVTPIFFSNDSTASFDNLGVHPINKVYAGVSANSSNKDWGTFCLAPSKAAAAKLLGIAESAVREFDLTISPELLPTTRHIAAAAATEPVIAEADKPKASAPAAPKPVAPAKFTAEHIGRLVEFTKDGVVAKGTLMRIDSEKEVAHISKGKGRPTTVGFTDVRLFDGAPTETVYSAAPVSAPAVKLPEAAAIDLSGLDMGVEIPPFDIADHAKMFAFLQKAGTLIVKTGAQADIKSFFDHVLVSASATGAENPRGQALHSTIRYACAVAKKLGILHLVMAPA